jgi:adenine phosphoribosyltransferase
MDISAFIRDVSDFPRKGVIYKDITPLLQNKEAFKAAINGLVAHYADQQIDLVLGLEARGFLIAAAVAYAMDAGLIIARKPGKLPYEVIRNDYSTEYSKDSLHIHKDAIYKGQKVLIVDDVLATGGTAKAAYELVNQLGGKVSGFGFLLELSFLNGRNVLPPASVYSLLSY